MSPPPSVLLLRAQQYVWQEAEVHCESEEQAAPARSCVVVVVVVNVAVVDVAVVAVAVVTVVDVAVAVVVEDVAEVVVLVTVAVVVVVVVDVVSDAHGSSHAQSSPMVILVPVYRSKAKVLTWKPRDPHWISTLPFETASKELSPTYASAEKAPI